MLVLDHDCVLFFPLRELLSFQQHYDWGLRALKTILKGCGNLLQNAKISFKESGKKGMGC